MALLLDIVEVLAGPERVEDWRGAYLASLQPRPDTGVIESEPSVRLDLPEPAALVGVDHHLVRLSDAPDGTVALIHGLPGVGKTEIAVAAAVAARRAGCRTLLVRCRGYDDDGRDGTQQIARAVLRALGLSPDHITRLSDDVLRQNLTAELGRVPTVLILDDVGPRTLVAPLLRSGGARVIVTSRHRLDIDAALEIWLDVLEPENAVALLTRHIGHERVAAEPAAARELVALCSHLPVEIVVASRSVLARPTWTLTDHARRLAEIGVDSAVRRALVDSYRQLAPDEARTLRLLSLHPGETVRVDAAAALAGLPVERATAIIAAMRQAHLLQPIGSATTWHDVVRHFARRRLIEEEPHSSQRVALGRLLEFYVVALQRASEALYPGVAGRTSAVVADVEMADLDDAVQLRAFFDAERGTIAKLAEAAARWEMPNQLSDLSALMFGYLSVSEHLREAVALHGLAATHGAADRRAQALRHRARALEEQGRYDEALAELDDALALEEHEVERVHQARGNVWLRKEHYDEAVRCYELALQHAESAGNRLNVGFAQSNIAEALRLSGDIVRATRFAEAAMATFAALGNEAYRSIVRGNLGLIVAASGETVHARSLLAESAAAAEVTGNVAHATRMLSALAVVELDGGDPAAAQAVLDRAEQAVGADRRPDVYLEVLSTRARIEAATGREVAARERYDEIVRLARRTGTRSALAHAYNGLGELAAAEGDHETARAHHERVLALVELGGDLDQRSRARRGLAALG